MTDLASEFDPSVALQALMTAANSVTEPYVHGRLVCLEAIDALHKTKTEIEKAIDGQTELLVDVVTEGEDG